MKDSLGGSMLLYLVVIFTSIIILFFVGILSYSKAYKVKNKIIEIIERYDGEIMDSINNAQISPTVLDEINLELSNVGYKVVSSSNGNRNDKCSKDSSRGTCTNLNTSSFNYCLCAHSDPNSVAEKGAKIFEVITYVQFEFPVIGDLLTFPVRGETRILGKNYNY